mgnify:CR=1 FL=1
MDAQRIAVDAVVALTDCDRERGRRLHPQVLSGRRHGPQAPDLQGPAGAAELRLQPLSISATKAVMRGIQYAAASPRVIVSHRVARMRA